MAERNPKWTRDELILVLDLYVRHKGNPPGKTSKEVLELSDLLNAMGRWIDGKQDTYRNPAGVYMKAMNFRRFDPAYASTGRSGLSRGGKGDEEAWNAFHQDNEKLHQVAKVIRNSVVTGYVPQASPEDDDEIAEAEEGRLLTRIHRQRERSRSLVEKKKAASLAKHGHLKCEACGFEFEAVYGERGKGFIEAHHVKPLHTLEPGSKTSIDDLALLCSNCHRMVHARKPWLTIEQLSQLVKG